MLLHTAEYKIHVKKVGGDFLYCCIIANTKSLARMILKIFYCSIYWLIENSWQESFQSFSMIAIVPGQKIFSEKLLKDFLLPGVVFNRNSLARMFSRIFLCCCIQLQQGLTDAVILCYFVFIYIYCKFRPYLFGLTSLF